LASHLTLRLAGAFTPVCSARHVPGYIEALPELRKKGVDVVAVLAYNDAYVMSAWGKANKVTGDDIVCYPQSIHIQPNYN
jgi:alkyl hydroperoxide reductase 1